MTKRQFIDASHEQRDRQEEQQMASSTKVKTFGGNRPLEEIQALCRAQGVEFIDVQHRRGSDYVTLRSPGAWVMFNTFNGRFFGKTPDNIEFSSDDKRDGTPWFDALLNFFYVPKAARA
jgi:hypothetical protein